MGLKDNFSQAVKDLTGNTKDEDKRKNTQVSGLKRALDNSDNGGYNAEYMDEGVVSGPYYRDNPPPDSNAARNNGSYGTVPQNDGYYDRNRGNGEYYDQNRQNNGNYGSAPQNGGYYDQNRQNNGSYGSAPRNDAEQRQGNYGAPPRGDGYYDQSRGNNAANYGSRNDGGNYGGREQQPRDHSAQQGQSRNYNARPMNEQQGRNSFNDTGNGRRDDYGSNDGRGNERNTYPAARRQDNEPQEFSDELTIISKNTIIDGNVRSFANMSIDGDIKGDVETTKNIELNGRIVGNMTCNNANMIVSQVQGDVVLKGNVEIGRDTLLIGDLSSGYASINGKVKGNVVTTGKAEFKADAVVFGDISASTITVDDGAIIQGYVSTTFLNKEESVNIFPDAVTIDE